MKGTGIGALVGTGIYLASPGVSYIVNTREVNPEGIERKLLDENYDKKRVEYISIPIKNGGYTNMKLEKDGIYTSLEYRNSELKRYSEKALELDQKNARSNYDKATKKINENNDKRKEKNDESKRTFGWETKQPKDSKEEKSSTQTENRNYTNLEVLENN